MTAPGKPNSDLSSTTPSVAAAITKGEGAGFGKEAPIAQRELDARGQMEPHASSTELVPVSLAEANAFVARHHRHHKPVPGHKFSIALSDGEAIRGVVIVGRPVSRHLDNGLTLEVNRCCTDGIRNGCSKLYRAAWRAAENMGFKRLITYTLPDEGGASLRGAGFRLLGKRGGGSWDRKQRPRVDTAPLNEKHLWEFTASAIGPAKVEAI